MANVCPIGIDEPTGWTRSANEMRKRTSDWPGRRHPLRGGHPIQDGGVGAELLSMGYYSHGYVRASLSPHRIRRPPRSLTDIEFLLNAKARLVNSRAYQLARRTAAITATHVRLGLIRVATAQAIFIGGVGFPPRLTRPIFWGVASAFNRPSKRRRLLRELQLPVVFILILAKGRDEPGKEFIQLLFGFLGRGNQ